MASGGEVRIPVYYSLVSRGSVVLCDYIVKNEGNLYSLSQEALSKAKNATTTITSGNQMAHVLREQKYLFLCVTPLVQEDQDISSVFAFLGKVKASFEAMGLKQRAESAPPYSLRTEFAFTLKTLMEETVYGDSRVRQMSGKADMIRRTLSENLRSIQERENKLDELSESSSLLMSGSAEFNRRSSELRRKTWCSYWRLRICIASVVIGIFLILLAIIAIAVGVTVANNNNKKS